MTVPGADKAIEQSLGELAHTVSDQTMALVRQELDRARRELTAKARDASAGAGMVGGGALLGTLAAGTGTAALVLLLARRPGPSAAAFGVTGLYAGAGAWLARAGIARLQGAAPPVPEETGGSVKQTGGSVKEPLGSVKKGVRSSQKKAAGAASRAKRQTSAARLKQS